MKPISLPPTPGASAAGAEPPGVAAGAAVPAAVVGVLSAASLVEPHGASARAPATSRDERRLVFTRFLFWRPCRGASVQRRGAGVVGGGGRQVIDCSKTLVRPSGISSLRRLPRRIRTRMVTT